MHGDGQSLVLISGFGHNHTILDHAAHIENTSEFMKYIRNFLLDDYKTAQ